MASSSREGPLDSESSRRLLEAIPFPAAILDANDHFVRMNEGFHHLQELNPDLAQVRPGASSIQLLLRTGEEAPGRWMELNATPVQGSGHRLVCVRDVHEWRALLDLNARTERLLWSAMELGGVAWFQLGPQPGSLAMDLQLRSRFDLSEARLHWIEDQLRAVPTWPSFDLRLDLPFAPGLPPRSLRLKGESFSDSQEEGGSRVFGVMIDVTDQRLSEHLERERAVIGARSRMAAYISHEINNPLGGIKNAALLLRRRLGAQAEPEALGYIRLLEQGVERIQSVVHLLSAIHRPIDPAETVPVQGLLAELADLTSRKVAQGDLQIDIRCEEGLGATDILAEILRQIVFNLILNAIEATPPGGRIQVDATRSEAGLQIDVANEGPGIPPDLIEAIWEPHFSTKRPNLGGGLTLGLSLGRSLARAFGGDLRLVEGPSADWTCFQLFLPEDR